MEPLQWERRPRLERPVIIAAFGGWNDAGEAATTAVRYLAATWTARPFASIDPEDFFDFTESRPTVTLGGGTQSSIEWPGNHFLAGSIPSRRTDIVLLDGMEPQLKWRTFCDSVLTCASELNASMMITLGALLADVPHTRPVHLTGTTRDPSLLERLDLQESRYEGPAGIVGVLHDACSRANLPSASLWAAVPHYVSQTPSPKATLALVRRVADLLDAPVPTSDLEIASASYERQVSELVEDDEDMVAYVTSLEEAHEEEAPHHADNIAAEAEKFLRNQDNE